MIKVKHFMEALEADDGRRIWVEPIGMTLELQEWCKVGEIMSQVGPPRELWQWFEEHPDGYEYFRGRYHDVLSRSPHKPALRQLAWLGNRENITLLHHGDDPQHNTATALYEFLSELATYCPPENQ